MQEQPRMCDMCGIRPATHFFKKSINGVKTEKCLCDHCASVVNQGDLFEAVFGSGFYPAMFGFQSQPVGQTRMRVCPHCGTTERDVLENYRFGCSECYRTFRDIAEQYVSRLGGKVYHAKPQTTKQQPAKSTQKQVQKEQTESAESELDRLRRLKDEAVQKEDFLLAQKYHEQIQALTAKKGGAV